MDSFNKFSKYIFTQENSNYFCNYDSQRRLVIVMTYERGTAHSHALKE